MISVLVRIMPLLWVVFMAQDSTKVDRWLWSNLPLDISMFVLTMVFIWKEKDR